MLHYETYSILFIVLILNLASNSNSIFQIEYKSLNYLGKISYGIYMYHPIAIGISLGLLNHFGQKGFFIIFTLTSILTIILSVISYELFEIKFIKLSNKFSSIISGDNVL